LFPTSRSERRAVANAMRDSHEFGVIQELLGATEFANLAVDVQRAVKGTLHRSEAARAPYQFQSQLWVGSIFHAAGLTPDIPQCKGGKSPDYVITVEGTRYGVEVKRPTKASNIPSAIDDAYDQLREYDIAGGLAIDVSDCLDDSLLFAYEADSTRPPYEAIETAFSSLYREAGNHLVDVRTHRPRPAASRIFFAIVYLHGWRWFRKSFRGPESYTATQVGRFVSAKGNLRYWDAERIGTSYIAGLERTGLYVTRETSEVL